MIEGYVIHKAKSLLIENIIQGEEFQDKSFNLGIVFCLFYKLIMVALLFISFLTHLEGRMPEI
jgi:hypothetical protein